MRPHADVTASFGKRALLALAAFVLVPAACLAQAWTPPAGTGSLWLTGQALHADAHTEGDGTLVHNIDLHSRSLTASVDYGVTDRLALSVSLPYVTSRYRGPVPHAGSTVDDGAFHGAVSDLDLEIRYRAVDGRVVLTPFIGGQWPTRNYETLGHAAAGRGLTEYSAGVDAGHEAQWLASGLFLGAGYQYSIVEKPHDDLSVNRSTLDLRVAWYATPRLGIHAGSQWQRTHGGLDIPLTRAQRVAHARHHDQMLRADHWRASTGISYSVRPDLDLSLSWATVLQSANSHSFRTLGLGIGWTFDSRRLLRRQPNVARLSMPDVR